MTLLLLIKVLFPGKTVVSTMVIRRPWDDHPSHLRRQHIYSTTSLMTSLKEWSSKELKVLMLPEMKVRRDKKIPVWTRNVVDLYKTSSLIIRQKTSIGEEGNWDNKHSTVKFVYFKWSGRRWRKKRVYGGGGWNEEIHTFEIGTP